MFVSPNLSRASDKASRTALPESQQHWATAYKLDHDTFERYLGNLEYFNLLINDVEIDKSDGAPEAWNILDSAIREHCRLAKFFAPGLAAAQVTNATVEARFSRRFWDPVVPAKAAKDGGGGARFMTVPPNMFLRNFGPQNIKKLCVPEPNSPYDDKKRILFVGKQVHVCARFRSLTTPFSS
jgi:hypothetical protein